MQQNEILADTATNMWNAYVYSVEVQAEMQYQQDMLTKEFISHQFSSPEIVISNLNGVGMLLEAGTLYCGAVSLEWAVPTLGMSVKTAGSVAVVLGIASFGFYAAAWVVDRIALEGGA